MKTVRNFVQTEKKQFISSERAFLPQYILVPYLTNKSNDLVYSVGENESVEEGQVILASTVKGSTHQVKICAPLPGRIISKEQCYLPDGHNGTAFKIKLEGAFSYLGKNEQIFDWSSLSSEAIINSFSDLGVVNTFYSSTPLCQQIEFCKLSRGRFVVVRMFDDDPSRVTDSFVSANFTKEICIGALITARALNAQGIVLALPKRKGVNIPKDVFSSITIPVLYTYIDDNRYPAGFKQTIIRYVKKTQKTEEQKIFNDINNKSLFVDPQTMYSVYCAIVHGKPVLETFVHVTGDCLKTASLLKIRIGTSIKDIIKQCGGFKTKPAKIIINGMLTGSAVSSLETIITSQVKSITFIPLSKLQNQSLSSCVRCGRCRAICPENIYPDLMFRYRLGGKPIGMDLIATADFCTGCNLCNSVCPSRLPLSQVIELLRKNKNDIR